MRVTEIAIEYSMMTSVLDIWSEYQFILFYWPWQYVTVFFYPDHTINWGLHTEAETIVYLVWKDGEKSE